MAQKAEMMLHVFVGLYKFWVPGTGGDSPWLMLLLRQPHADSLLHLDAGHSSVTHLVLN